MINRISAFFTATKLIKRSVFAITITLILSSIGHALDDDQELLPAKQAFALSMSKQTENLVKLKWDIHPCCYLYKDQVVIKRGDGSVAQVVFPDAISKNDPDFGLSEVYQQSLTLLVPSTATERAKGPLTIRSQGCNSDVGVCYPPLKQTFNFISTVDAATVNGETPDKGQSKPISSGSISGGILALIIGAFASGLLLTFTPCVLPMLPILSSIIVGGGQAASRTHGAALATSFVMGTTLTYAAIGAIAGATGKQLQAYFQHPIMISSMSLLLMLMALSMFGVFNLQMPGFIQSRLQEKSSSMQGGRFTIVFFLGVLSSLIIGACVSPVLISFLGVAMQSQSPTLGAVIMFSMSLGMGVPLVLFGAGAGALLPKAGLWMNAVKNFFGVVLIGVAIYLLNAVPQAPVLFLWACALITLSIFLGATQGLTTESDVSSKLKKGLGTVSLVWGILSLIGSAYGERDLFNPLPSTLMAPSSYAQKVNSSKLKYEYASDLDVLVSQLEKAQSQGKYVLIDFYADWCTDCVKMDKSTFNNEQLIADLKQDFVMLKVDLTDPSAVGPTAIKQHYGVFGPPAVLFIHPSQGLVEAASFYGYKSADELAKVLEVVRGTEDSSV